MLVIVGELEINNSKRIISFLLMPSDMVFDTCDKILIVFLRSSVGHHESLDE